MYPPGSSPYGGSRGFSDPVDWKEKDKEKKDEESQEVHLSKWDVFVSSLPAVTIVIFLILTVIFIVYLVTQ